MRFELTEEQSAIRELAEKVVGDHGSRERVRSLERAGTPIDRELWTALAGAGLLGIPLPEAVGGLGLGFLETCVLLEVIGRFVVASPVLESIVLGAWPLSTFGGPAHQELVEGAAAGTVFLTAAMEELAWQDVDHPSTTARRDGGGWRLHGMKEAVPYAGLVARILTTASTEDGDVAVFVVDPASTGVDIADEVSTTGAPLGQLRLDGVRVEDADVLGAAGPFGRRREVAGWMYRRGVAGMCVLGAGVLAGGLRITADYIGQREQFDRPIATFQGAAIRVADAYIDSQAVWLTAWSAAWQLSEGRPADEALAIAKFWMADGGQRAVHAFQHLHGGIGVDEDYPIHRFFNIAKSLEVGLGGATPQLLRLGAVLAGEEAGGVH